MWSTDVINFFQVVSISCGQPSSMVALENGDVYAWGYNGNGQLGLGNNINQLNACKIPTLQGIVIIKVRYSLFERIFHFLHLNHFITLF